MSRSVIITCAVTGGIHTPTMSPHLPVTPAEITAAAVGAAEAGAAIIHLHARHPETGRPDPRVETFAQFLSPIKEQTDAVINISTGGGLGMSREERILAAGRHQMPFATQSAMLGGNLRVGLEDSLYIRKGVLAESNAQQVANIRTIIENLGLAVATPAEARQRLALKGSTHVNF